MDFSLKYSPDSFENYVGQEQVVSVLKEQLETNTTSRAMIFHGVTGIGKTSLALIVANWQATRDNIYHLSLATIVGESGGKSATTVLRTAIAEWEQPPLLIRSTPPLQNKKVIILDEVQTFSSAAQEVLLQTLENPATAPFLRYILCTTEIKSLKKTIIGRSVVFDLLPIPTTLIVGRLQYILEQEGIVYTYGDLNVVAQLSEGSLRNALTILPKFIKNNKLNVGLLQGEDFIDEDEGDTDNLLRKFCNTLIYGVYVEADRKDDYRSAKPYCGDFKKTPKLIECLQNLRTLEESGVPYSSIKYTIINTVTSLFSKEKTNKTIERIKKGDPATRKRVLWVLECLSSTSFYTDLYILMERLIGDVPV